MHGANDCVGSNVLLGKVGQFVGREKLSHLWVKLQMKP